MFQAIFHIILLDPEGTHTYSFSFFLSNASKESLQIERRNGVYIIRQKKNPFKRGRETRCAWKDLFNVFFYV